MSSKILNFGLRIPQSIRDRLQEVAKANKRSMNSEIIHLLEKEFSDLPKNKKSEATA